MQTRTNNAQTWIAPLAGCALILIGCVQVAYSTVAIVSAIGVAGAEALALLVQGLFSISNNRAAPELKGIPGGATFIDAALNIAALGFVLAALAVAAGILVLRGKQAALYATAGLTLCAFLLAYRHLAVAWLLVATTYAILGAVFTALLVYLASSHHSPALADESTLAQDSKPPKPPPQDSPRHDRQAPL